MKPGTLLTRAALLAAPGLSLAKDAVTRADTAHAPATPRPLVADTVEDDDDDASPQREPVHVVIAGETLGGVANRAHVPRVLIIEANNLKPPYALREGERLRLPRTRHHTVAKGETGFDIAYHYGVPFAAIATANGLDPDAEVEPGQKLLIPTITHAKGNPRIAKPAEDASAKATPPAKLVAGGEDAPTAPPASHSLKVDPDARFIWPLAGKVLRGFAAGGGHDGVDIAGTLGTTVRASSGGEVVFAGVEPQSFGRLVLIDHKNGWQTAYGFLGKITVAKGDHVRVGERIGLVGHSGKARRDELHFELRRAQRPVDPLPKLPDQPAAALISKNSGR